MKLKKMISLALAGIMAISMLTACGGKGESNSGNTETPVAPAAGVSGKIQSLLDEGDLITLTDNATYQTYLSAAIEKAKLDGSNVNTNDGLLLVSTEVSSLFENNVVGYKDLLTTISQNPNDFYKNNATYPIVLSFEGDYSEDVILNSMAQMMNLLITKDNLKSNVKIKDGKDSYVYSCEYTGSVSMQKVTVEGNSAWYFLFTIAVDSNKTKVDA